MKLRIHKVRGAWVVDEVATSPGQPITRYEGWRHGVAFSFEDARMLVIEILRLRQHAFGVFGMRLRQEQGFGGFGRP